MKANFCLYKNTNVRYIDKGKGRTLVLVHGFLGSADVWENFIEPLSKSFRVVAIDLPGHGETPAIGYLHSMEMLAGCVKAVLTHLKLRKYIIVGHSMGGYVALAYADLHPNNLKGICLFNSTAFADSDTKKADRDRAIKVVKESPRIYVNELIPKLFAQHRLDELKTEIKKVKIIASLTSKQGIIASLEGMKIRPDRTHILRLRIPILFVAGEKDNVIPIDTIEKQLSFTNNPHSCIIPECGHMGMYEFPEDTMDAVKKFSTQVFKGNKQ